MIGDVFDFEKPITEVENLIQELKSPQRREEALHEGIDLSAKIAELEEELHRVMVRVYKNLSPWEKTQLARHKDRPYSLDYIRLIFDDFFELNGDRLAANDEAIVGGPAILENRPVMVIGQQKGRDIKERQRRNFGSAHAEGFRKALRLARLAERFHMPLITLVDTAGAAADLHAEEFGVSEAIAHNLREFSLLKTPIIVTIIGEGGSGGALGLAIGDHVSMLEHSIYSVISPEGCAAILWHDKSRASDAAKSLCLTASNAHSLGVIDDILPEPLGGAHRDPVTMAETIKTSLLTSLNKLDSFPSVDILIETRYQRLRRMGEYVEQTPSEEESNDG